MHHHSVGKVQQVFGYIFLGFAVISLLFGIIYYPHNYGLATKNSLQLHGEFMDAVDNETVVDIRPAIIASSVTSIMDISNTFLFVLPIYVLCTIMLFALAVLLLTQGYANMHHAADITSRQQPKDLKQ